MSKKALLVILDGWGHGKDEKVSAIAQGHTPYIDSLYDNYPHAELVTYGEEVGLPEGQMGNSEVGHLNIGAGRVVYQELARINKAIKEDTLRQNPVIVAALEKAKQTGKPLHLMGLLSDGGVHSHIEHIVALAGYFTAADIKVYIHAFLDGRDTGPRTGKKFLAKLLEETEGTSAELSTIIGRYYAMDRDNRWERIAKAYDLLVRGEGELTSDPLQVVQQQYDQDITDEFLEPIKVRSRAEGLISKDDLVLFANFRTDRPRQLTTALTQKKLEHGMEPLACHFITMTEYDDSFKNIQVVYRKDDIEESLGELIANAGLTQLRIAETEKYPHVSFFFSGGREAPYEGESRIMVESPKVATYDLQPEMSAYEVTTKVDAFITEQAPSFIVLNYANADMVGHTGSMPAAIKAVETLDSCMEVLIPRAVKAGYRIVVIADHGNSDIMLTEENTPHTAHTVNMVPIIVIDPEGEVKSVKNGKLADVAPTIISLMNLGKSELMNGDSLV